MHTRLYKYLKYVYHLLVLIGHRDHYIFIHKINQSSFDQKKKLHRSDLIVEIHAGLLIEDTVNYKSIFF